MKRIEPVYIQIILKGSPLTMPGYDKNYSIDIPGKQIIIKDCEITDHLVFVEDFIYPYNILFQNCVFSGNFVIQKGIFKKITFSGARQGLYSFHIHDGTFESLSFLEYSSFQSDFKIHGGNFQDLSFQGGTSIKNQVFIAGCTIKLLAFFDSKFESPVKFMSVTGISFLMTRNIKMTELIFYGGEFSSIDIGEKSGIDKLNISGGTYGSVSIKTEDMPELYIQRHAKNVGLELEEITFSQMGKINGFVQGCKIGKMKFSPSYIHKDAILRFLNVSIQSLSFNGLVNYGQLGFSNLELEKDISFSNSDLGKTSFINSNMAGVKMNFADSRITDAFFSKGSFPQRIAEDEHQQRQAFAQLKKINETKGDYLEANHFYAKEMNAFYRTITWKKHFWEKLNLWFNKYSNDHGQSWQLGLAAVLAVTIFFYGIYLLCLGLMPGSVFQASNWALFLKCLSYSPEFLNPVHRTDEIAKGLGLPATSCARLLEGLSRVFIAFAIYQLIQAFRKHGKK